MTDKRTCMHCLHHSAISRDIPPSVIRCMLIGCGVKWDESCDSWEQDDPKKRRRLRGMSRPKRKKEKS